MVEWKQMKRVVGVALGTLVIVGWIVGLRGGGKGVSAGLGRVAVQERTSSGRLVVNPVVRVSPPPTSVFAPVPACQTECLWLE